VDVFSILTLVVALIAVIRLRSVFGRRSGEDDERVQRRMRDSSLAQQSDKVVNMPRRDREHEAQPPLGMPEPNAAEMVATRIKAIGGDTPLAQNLTDMVEADPTFDPDQFVMGAKRAYELIVNSFAEGNRKSLRDLLSADVYKEFERAIQDRESRQEKIEQTFVGINKADIIDAEIERGNASVTMRFVSQLITAVRSKSGEIVSGDLARVKDVTDLWTFSRDVSTPAARRNPNWRLVSTKHSN
jgi:predicted lipid-binding transport protein (Tim44 family)